MEIRGLKVLLVDDITDTGDTVEVALEHIREFGPAEVRLAVLQHKKQSTLRPDYYAGKIVKWRWIIYPWAVVEDIGGFLRAMPDLPATVEAADRMLQQDYGVRVPAGRLELVFRMMEKENHR